MVEGIGIVGGGQLGRMLTQAAIPLGFEVTVIDAVENSPAAQVGANQITAALTDTEAIRQLADMTDVLTWEIEHIPADFLISLAESGVAVEPSPHTLAMIQDKLCQKQFLQAAGIPVAPFSESLDESKFLGGGPYVVKTRKGGYDGRGNLVVASLDQAEISNYFGEQPIYVEQAVAFEKEIAVIAARDKQGRIVTYPPVETIHQDNICHLVISPPETGSHVLNQAHEIAYQTLKQLKGAGVFAIEMFVVDGQVMVNEIAPRVHNSGHHTIEANQTSQFEQHIRAVTGLPLGSTEMRAPAAAMINILGTRDEPLSREDYEVGIYSAHRTPDRMKHYAKTAEERGLQVIIAGAGGSGHLPGMVASETIVPILGVAITSNPDVMNRALGSMIGMPEGKPLATFQAEAGAFNAGLFAVRLLAMHDPELAEAYRAYEKDLRTAVIDKHISLGELGMEGYIKRQEYEARTATPDDYYPPKFA